MQCTRAIAGRLPHRPCWTSTSPKEAAAYYIQPQTTCSSQQTARGGLRCMYLICTTDISMWLSASGGYGGIRLLSSVPVRMYSGCQWYVLAPLQAAKCLLLHSAKKKRLSRCWLQTFGVIDIANVSKLLLTCPVNACCGSWSSNSMLASGLLP